MGSTRVARTGGENHRLLLVSVWSLVLLTPLVTAYDNRFCADYYDVACRSPEMFDETITICKCFIKGTDLCCNFDGEDGVLVPVEMGAFNSVFVGNASSVKYTPFCGTPQKVTFENVNDLLLLKNVEFSRMDCLVDIKAVDSTVENILSHRGVELYTSSAKRIADSTLMVRLVLDRSQAETIENFTMAQSTSVPAECLSFDGSSVSNLRNIVATCDAHIDKSKIKQISETTLSRSRISYSEIEKVLTNGLTLQHGWHKMVNVTIQHLQINSLTFSTFTKVNLFNLEIVQCDMPCIISKSKYVYFENLIINGNKIADISDTPYIDVERYEDTTLIGSNSSLCNKIGTSLECRSDRASEYKVIEFQPDFSFLETKLSKFSLSLGITSHCFKVLKLEEVNGWVRILRQEDPNYKDPCQYDKRKIVINDCKLIDYLQTDYLDQLYAEYSEVQFVDISSRLSRVDMIKVKIHVLENMEYASRSGVKSSFNLKSVTITSMYNLLLKSPGLLTDFSVLGRVSNFTLDTSPEATTTVRGGIMRSVAAQGITIRSGILALDNVRILEMGYGAIHVEQSGRLLIIPSEELLQPFVCEKGPRIISQRKSQVVFHYPIPRPHWLRQCTKTSGDDLEELENFKLKFKTFVTSQDCNFDLYQHATCNMSNAEGPTLLGGTSALDSAVGVSVTDCANLTVGDHCFDVVELEGVASADFMDIKNSCYFKLILKNQSSVLNVVNNLYDLEVNRGWIRKLAPSATLERVYAANSTIRSLSATIKRGLFTNVTFKNINTLKVVKEVEFVNCNLTKFYKGSVEVEKGAILRFTNCSINMMSAKSFNVKGSLHMTNVTINVAENETLSMDGDSFVTMDGVHFRKEVSNLFSIDSPPHILLNQVKMNKILVRLDKLIDVSISFLNGTVVGQGHLQNETPAVDISVWFCLTTTHILIIICLTTLSVVIFVVFVFIKKRREGKLPAQGQPPQVQGQLQTEQALQGQQRQQAPEDVPLKVLSSQASSEKSICDSTATTSTSESAALVVEETAFGSTDSVHYERDKKQEGNLAGTSGVQPHKGGPKKAPSKASDDPERARDDDEEPLLTEK